MTEEKKDQDIQQAVESKQGSKNEDAVFTTESGNTGVVEQEEKEPIKRQTKRHRENATGKRKEAIARVIITPGKGNWNINGKTLEEYFPNKVHQQIVNMPFEVTKSQGLFDVKVTVKGGGVSGQAGAVRHGIARSLNNVDREVNRPTLKRNGLLTRDDRIVERKKAGLKKARKASQFSKR